MPDNLKKYFIDPKYSVTFIALLSKIPTLE